MPTYSRKNLLSLKLHGATYLQRLSRREMLTRLQIVRELDPITDWAYKVVEEKKHREQLDDDPHGEPWHVSFHASKFPGDAVACPRAALYSLMDFGREAGDRKARNLPFDRKSRTIMAAGKAAELELVQTYSDAGILLSAKPDDEIQTGFEWPEAWLTGSVDCVIQRPGEKKPTPIEIKTKYQAAIDEMKLGKRGPDLSHIFQLKVQLALIHHSQQKNGLWSDLEPVTHGFIYYLSRDRPSDTAEFRVDLDLRFFDIGVARLIEWIEHFKKDELPEEPKGKRTTNFGHPMGAAGFKWSELPCQWCDFKKTCQLDFRQDQHTLTESIGVNRTKAAREHYDPIEARKRVFERWSRG